jgi:hypothetical protein
MAKGRAWKLERASVSVPGKSRPRSNKYSGGDASKKPAPGTRQQIWVGGYTRPTAPRSRATTGPPPATPDVLFVSFQVQFSVQN